jgi:hypothetical protein
MGKTFPAATLLVLLLLAVTGAHIVSLAGANPYYREWEWVEEEVLTPPSDTQPPAILFISPKNNSAYASNNVSMIFTVRNAALNNVSFYITEMYYKASWQHVNQQANTTYVDLETFNQHPSQFYINLTDIPEGPRWLEIYASAKAIVNETRHSTRQEGMTIKYTTYYTSYRIACSSVVNFIIDTTTPKVSVPSVENKTYNTREIELDIRTDEPVSSVICNLDGQMKALIKGNATLTDLPNGEHNITIFARDPAGNLGVTETLTFSISYEPETFPTAWAATGAVSAILVGACLIICLKKSNQS